MPRDTKESAKNYAQAYVRGKIADSEHHENLNLACEYLELRSRLTTMESMWGFRIPVVFIVAVMGLGCVLASVAVGVAINRVAQCEKVDEVR